MKLSASVLLLLLPTMTLSAGVGGEEPTAEGKAISYWIGELQQSDITARIQATNVLMRMGEAAVPFLVQVLEHDTSDARLLVLATLPRMGPAARAALPAASALLRDKSPAVRVTAAATIVGIDCSRGQEQEVWSVLVTGLDGDGLTASVAAISIGSLGADGVRAVPALVRLLEGNNDVQATAISALWKMGPAAKEAVPALEAVAKMGEPIAISARAALETIRGDAPTPVSPCRERRTTQKQ
jgi:HEAT repeat protein